MPLKKLALIACGVAATSCVDLSLAPQPLHVLRLDMGSISSDSIESIDLIATVSGELYGAATRCPAIVVRTTVGCSDCATSVLTSRAR
jgi:hypothetical protein